MEKQNLQENSKLQVKIFNFNASYVPPIYKQETKGEYRFLSWGADNLYPVYLLQLYNNYGSPLHKAIVNKKVKLSTGFGLKPVVNPVLQRWVEKNRLQHLLKYLSVDFEIYNGCAVEVIWNREGTSFDVNYIPIHTLRLGLKETEDEPDYFWYSSDWANIKKDEHKPIYIKKYNPLDKTGRSIAFYIEPNPSHTNMYPIPTYSNCVNYIDIQYQVGVYHANQIRQGFHGGYVMNFATGIPQAEEMRDFQREFERNYASAQNAGKIIMTFSEGRDQAPELTPIQLNDSDERFQLLEEMAEKNIAQGHETPIQLISFQPGKLGSTDERKELLAEFQTYYITPRQEQLEYLINTLIYDMGIEEKIVLKTYSNVEETGLLTEESTSPLSFEETDETELPK
jgi:hypothetical protein